MVIGTNIPCKNGNLKITKRIGSGSFSDIFLACDKDNVEYALKFLKHNEEIDRSLLLTEAKLIATINAPFLRTVYEIGVFDNRPYLVLHYFDGVSLASLLDNEKKFDIKKILVILKQLSLALSKIHQRGLVHRDIKLENILIDDDLNICLIDFGLAQEQENLENEGLIGSFYYMSPEQCRALHRPVDHRSDLYSLGIVAFACVTGHLPFQGQSIPEMVDHHAKTPIPDFKKFGIDAPDVIEKIIRKLLSKDPDDRYQSAEGLYHDLQNFEDLSKKPIEKELLDRNFTKDQIFCKTSMYGREKEIEEMQKAYTSMKSEHGILLIEGQPGLGKSRLVSEFFKDHEGSHYVGHYKSKKNYQSPFLGIRALFQNLILKFNNNQKKFLRKN
ncbi:MAG: protein kinase [Oligoflexales bacterium]